MLLEPTLTQLRELRLTGMAAALEEQQAVPDVQSLSFEDRLALLVDREATVRQDRRLTRLIEEMARARADDSYPKLMNRLQKTDLLAIDDYGLAPLNQTERRDLLEVIEDRTGRRATLVASQLPLEHWHEVIGDATFADAILDRLVHHAHRISLKGASMRRKEPKTTPAQTVTA
jgi:hypothetical protein